MTASKASLVPVFKLYGETTEWPTPDLIHCESIPERSQLHGWEIKPHRHADLLQLLYVQAGEAELEVEGQVRLVRSASLQVVPALCVHGFRFSRDVQGYVLSLARPLVEQLAAPLGQQCLQSPMCYEVGEQRRYLDALFGSISQEYGRLEPARELMLQSLISVLLVAIARRQLARSEAQEPADGRGREHVQAFVQVQLATHGPEQSRSFARLVDTQPAIISAWTLTGDADYLLRVYCDDLPALNRLIHEVLLPHPAVARVQSQIVMDQFKQDAPLPT